ncbi:hypothetical protein K8I61_04040 [bacterium]|nr:hypothetical protein [bacterium]
MHRSVIALAAIVAAIAVAAALGLTACANEKLDVQAAVDAAQKAFDEAEAAGAKTNCPLKFEAAQIKTTEARDVFNAGNYKRAKVSAAEAVALSEAARTCARAT